MIASQSRNVDREAAEPLPGAVRQAADRVAGALEGWTCDQVTVNDYPPGVGLNPHIDTHSAFAGRPFMSRHECMHQAA